MFETLLDKAGGDADDDGDSGGRLHSAESSHVNEQRENRLICLCDQKDEALNAQNVRSFESQT